MQEVFEKIIEKLEERTSFLSDCTKYGNKDAEQQNKSYSTVMMYEVADLVDDLIEIVKQEAEQYNNGWIPCSERLPKENGNYYVTQIVKSVSTGKKIAIEKSYVEFSIGEWRRAKNLEVIAWLDIEPYQPKGE